MDPWSVLGVRRGASAEEIKKAYLVAAQREHPDRCAGDSTRFLRVKEAYDSICSGSFPSASGPGGRSTGSDWAKAYRRGAGRSNSRRAAQGNPHRAADFHYSRHEQRRSHAERNFSRGPSSGLGIGAGAVILVFGVVASAAFAVYDVTWGRAHQTSLRASREAAERDRVEARERARLSIGKRGRIRSSHAGTSAEEAKPREPPSSCKKVPGDSSSRGPEADRA